MCVCVFCLGSMLYKGEDEVCVCFAWGLCFTKEKMRCVCVCVLLGVYALQRRR